MCSIIQPVKPHDDAERSLHEEVHSDHSILKAIINSTLGITKTISIFVMVTEDVISSLSAAGFVIYGYNNTSLLIGGA